MRALVYGVQPEPVPEPAPTIRSLAALARTPMRLARGRRPGVAPRRLGDHQAAPHRHLRLGLQAGVHGLGQLQRRPDNPMIDFTSFPQVLGHEVVADVVEVGPEAEGLAVGDRVVLNPWLSCAPRGIIAAVPRVRGRRPARCAGTSPTARSRPASTSARRRTCRGGYATS